MKLPAHFMVDTKGDLYDTRSNGWHLNAPLRAGYAGHNQSIDNVAEVKAALREGQCTGVGGYPVYFICKDGGVLSFDAARQNFKEIVSAMKNTMQSDWYIVAVAVNYEDTDLTCDHTGKPIECAYN